MAHLSGSDRSQLLLLPEAVDDYVGSDNPVRLIEAFVDSLDLVAAGFSRVTAKETGRPGYDPADLLKLYLYGYLNRVRSSRKLEAETRRNIEVIWLLRHLKPDYRTIASFRRVNCAAFKQIFREFAIVCRRLDLFGREMLAVDGTRIKAVNNRHRNFTRTKLLDLVRRADEKLSDYVKALDDGDADEEKAASNISSNGRSSDTEKKIAALRTRRQKFSSLLAELDRTGEDQISLTDPDSRAMPNMMKVGVGYNVQLAVDVKHKLIAEEDVSNNVLDIGLLAPTVESAMQLLGVEQIEAVADRGYYKIEDIEACEKAGITAYVPRPNRGSTIDDGFFSKGKFTYQPDINAYICPNGAVMSPRRSGKKRGLARTYFANRIACQSCSIKNRCTPTAFRQIMRLENEAVLDRMAERLSQRPNIMSQRKESVEHPFGTIKQWMNQGAFLMRGLNHVQGEFSLTAVAYNIRRAIALVSIPDLIGAMKA
jgi:transposase